MRRASVEKNGLQVHRNYTRVSRSHGPIQRVFFLGFLEHAAREWQLKFAIVVREAHTCASPTGLPWALVTERRLRSRLYG